MEKEITITAPEGYQIDDKKSTLTNIVFKLIEDNNLKNANTFILECFDGLMLKNIDLNSDFIRYYHNDDCYINYDKKYNVVYIAYKIWSILRSKYGLNYNEISNLITSIFGWKEFTVRPVRNL